MQNQCLQTAARILCPGHTDDAAPEKEIICPVLFFCSDPEFFTACKAFACLLNPAVADVQNPAGNPLFCELSLHGWEIHDAIVIHQGRYICLVFRDRLIGGQVTACALAPDGNMLCVIPIFGLVPDEILHR